MKKSFGLYLTLFVLLLCSCGQASVGTASGGRSEPDKGPTWEEQYELGLRYLSDGNYEEAIIAFTAAIEIDPKRAPAYVGRGDAYSGVGQKLSGQAGDAELPAEAVSSYESAVADYLAALDLDESTAEVYRKAAEVYVTLGDLDSAVALLERGVSATGDEDLQTYLDELIENQSEEEKEMVTVSGRIIWNMSEYEGKWRQYVNEYQDQNNRIVCSITGFGVRFDTPVHFEWDSSEIVLQEAAFIDANSLFNASTDLYNNATKTSGPMLGRLIEMTGYFIKRDPPGELTGPKKNDVGAGEFTEYVYHPNGEYNFYLESYQLLD